MPRLDNVEMSDVKECPWPRKFSEALSEIERMTATDANLPYVRLEPRLLQSTSLIYK